MMRLMYVSSTRADFGIVSTLLKKMDAHNEIDLTVVATGTHLSQAHGQTIEEIQTCGFNNLIEMPVEMCQSGLLGVCNITAQIHQSFSALLETMRPDALVILGDRFEILAIATVATHYQVPMIHLHGGELSLGAVDDAFRHAITKLSYLHFPATECYRQRIIQMGEAPDRVFNVGALGVENCLQIEKISRDELFLELGIPLDRPLCVVAYHPETIGQGAASQLSCVIEIVKRVMMDYTVVFTMANADAGGDKINKAFRELEAESGHLIFVESLGMKRFLSLVAHAHVLWGNSSAGIIEAPSLLTPSITIGDRQKGRMRGTSVFQTTYDVEENITLLTSMLSRNDEISTDKSFFDNPYACPFDHMTTSDKMIEIVLDCFDQMNRPKDFFDIQGIGNL